VGVFFKEAEERALEGIFHCLYFQHDGNPEPIYLSAQKSCVSVFSNGNRFALSQTATGSPCVAVRQI